MDQKHALSDMLEEMRVLLQEIAESLSNSHPPAASSSQPRTILSSFPRTSSPLSRGEWLDRQGVMEYLQISDRTYYRLKANGKIQPHRIGQRDYYYIPELAEPLRESIRRGRV